MKKDTEPVFKIKGENILLDEPSGGFDDLIFKPSNFI